MRVIHSIEGNIGSGKSTFLNLIKAQLPQIEVIPEPVGEWQSVSNRFNLLEQYYREPSRWAFTFQINAVLSRMTGLRKLLERMQAEEQQRRIYFSERSVVADREIFARLLHQELSMSDMEHALYLNMYDGLESLFEAPRLHKYIYLRTSPQKCLQRMAKRARSEETTVSLDYLGKIHRLHEDWLSREPHTLVIDG